MLESVQSQLTETRYTEFRERIKEKYKAHKKLDHKDASEKRRQSRISKKMDDTTCFACREKGHSLRDCPKNEEAKSATPTCFRSLLQLFNDFELTDTTDVAARTIH